MWDYDKLFAEGNVVGFYVGMVKDFSAKITDEYQNKILHNCYKNNSLSYCPDYCSKETETKIQYIIRLDEHGNVVEKLFDRERDVAKPMPELEMGMFVRVEDEGLGYVDTRNNRIVYQHGGYDVLDGDEYLPNVRLKIIEVYSENACAFSYCNDDVLIWRDPDYQAYLDSKYK